jgi:hypothetical protein
MWYNPIVQGLLQSPLHWFMSGNTLVLTYAGRKSGHPHQLPISYGREGNSLWLITHRRKTWWRNVVGGAPVSLLVQKQRLSGVATVTEVERATLLRYINLVCKGIPAVQAEKLLPDAVLVEIRLS